MTIAVYPRLGALLDERRLTVPEVVRQLRERFGLEVNPKTLYRLAQDAPVQRADLEIAGATAALLGVGLDDLFAVEAIPVAEERAEGEFTPAQSARLAELFARQAIGALGTEERRDLDALVAAYGRWQYEQQLRDYAERHALSVDEARGAVSADYDRALDWWRTLTAAPRRRKALGERARARRVAEDG